MNELLTIYLLECEVENKSSATIKNIKSRLTPFCAYVGDITNLNKVTINSYILSLKKRMLPQSINEHIKTIRKFIDYCYAEEYIDKPIIIKQLKTTKDTTSKSLTDNDIKRILSNVSGNDFISVRNRAIISTFVDTGIRVSELTQIKLADVSDTVTVTCKGKTRAVPITPKLQLTLMKYMKVRNKSLHHESEYLFFSRSGKQLNNDSIEKMLKRIDPKLHPHQFRHYYIQSLLLNGVNIFYISKLVGHDSIETTKTYLDGIDNKNIIDNVRKFSNL